MKSLDERVISQLCRWLDQPIGEVTVEQSQEQVAPVIWLCTVIHSWGSAPRLPGSLMACNQQGQVVGSLSGGCIEEDLIERLCSGQLARQSAVYKVYGESQAEVERFKLPCGGSLGILIEPLSAAQLPVFAAIEQAQQARLAITRECLWPAQGASLLSSVSPSLYSSEQPAGEMLTSMALEKAEASCLTFSLDGDNKPTRLRQVYQPVCQLMIIGVTEVSRFLAEFASAAGYRVTVCDPRPEMAEQWRVVNTTCITAMPDDAVRDQADAQTAIVALSHDPRIDDMGLMDAFATEAFYIGAMGSQRTSGKRRQRLAQLGVSAEALQRLHAPIGLDIGSKTPVEIALSIMAQLIAVRSAAG